MTAPSNRDNDLKFLIRVFLGLVLLAVAAVIAVPFISRPHGVDRYADIPAKTAAWEAQQHTSELVARRAAAEWDAQRAAALPLDSYTALKEGMTYDEVVRIVGAPGVERSRSAIGNTVTVLYAWQRRGSPGSMTVMFQNDRLVQKSQFGLD